MHSHLKEYTVYFALFIDYKFQFMHNNAQPQGTNVTRQLLNEVRVQTLERSTCSSELKYTTSLGPA